MKSYPIYLLFILCLNISCHAQTVDKAQETALIKGVVNTVQSNHLQPKQLDNDFSHWFIDDFINLVDPKKEFLTYEDLKTFAED